MSKPKRAHCEAFIHIACTHTQKEHIKENAKKVGAKSITEYILTLGLKGNTKEFRFMRRKADELLVTADTYRQLRDIVKILKTNPNADEKLIKETLKVIRKVGKGITLNRLKNDIENSL